MSGFKNFMLKGNLIELAVAFIMGSAFATVVTATVTLLMELIGSVIGDNPDFTKWRPGDIGLGAWLTAVVAFVILSAVVYFAIVLPYTKAKDRFFPAEPQEGGPTELDLLIQIRDALTTPSADQR